MVSKFLICPRRLTTNGFVLRSQCLEKHWQRIFGTWVHLFLGGSRIDPDKSIVIHQEWRLIPIERISHSSARRSNIAEARPIAATGSRTQPEPNSGKRVWAAGIVDTLEE